MVYNSKIGVLIMLGDEFALTNSIKFFLTYSLPTSLYNNLVASWNTLNAAVVNELSTTGKNTLSSINYP